MCKFYREQTQYFPEKKQLLDLANTEIDRGFRIAEKKLALQSDVFRSLGQAFIAYDVDKELEKAIDDIVNIKNFEFQGLHGEHSSAEDLEKLKNKHAELIEKKVDYEYMQKVNTLLKLLRSQLKESYSQ